MEPKWAGGSIVDPKQIEAHPHGPEVGTIQEKFRDVGKSKSWLSPEGKSPAIYVEYMAQKDQYHITVFWIEDWKPGNYGYRMRGDEEINTEDMPHSEYYIGKLLDTIRAEMLEWHEEIGYYPRNEEKRREYWKQMKDKGLVTQH